MATRPTSPRRRGAAARVLVVLLPAVVVLAHLVEADLWCWELRLLLPSIPL